MKPHLPLLSAVLLLAVGGRNPDGYKASIVQMIGRVREPNPPGRSIHARPAKPYTAEVTGTRLATE